MCLVQLSRPFPDWYLRGDNGDSSVLLLSWKEGNWASEDVDSTDMGHERICQRSGGWGGGIWLLWWDFIGVIDISNIRRHMVLC